MDARAVLEDNLELIHRLASSVCRRNAVYGADAEDFASWARLRLIENDHAILRKFQRRSSLATYLAVVVNNLFRDHRISRWGKWRPSAAARRLGPDAVKLETLIARDGQSVDEAIRTLHENAGIEASATDLIELVAQLPRRVQRRVETSDELDALPAPAEVENRIQRGERELIAERARGALERALLALDAEDRLVLKLRFDDGWTVATIARSLGLEQKPLYRRVESLLRTMRGRLENAGVDADQAADLIGWPRLEISVDYSLNEVGNCAVRPSTRETKTLDGGAP